MSASLDLHAQPPPFPEYGNAKKHHTRMHRITIGLLLFVGVELWYLVMHGLGIRRGQPTIIAIAAALALIRPIAREIARALDRVRHPTARQSAITASIIFVGSIALLYLQAVQQSRDFGLHYQDEYSYRIQTRMVAQDKLWMPEHPLAEFFQNFQLIAKPVYASVYFPGAAMLYAPGVWLGLATWIIPLLSSAGVVTLIYLIFTRLIDALAGLLGALLVVSNPIFREQSVMVMAQIPALLGALALVWSYLRFRDSPVTRRSAFMGMIAGWLMVTRPVDALVTIIPVGIGVLFDLRALSRRQRTMIVIAGWIGASPFLLLQSAFNLHVTGHITQTPFGFYTEQVYPGGTYGFHHVDPNARPAWTLPQVQTAYDRFSRALVKNHTPMNAVSLWAHDYLPATVKNVLPHSLLIVLLPVGLLGVRRRQWVLVAMAPLFVALYFPYLFYIRYYALIALPAGLLLIPIGIQILSDVSKRLRPSVLTFLMAAIVPLLISEWPTFNRMAKDDFMTGESLRQIETQLAALPHRPAIVLFHFTPGDAGDLEPVYNADVAWPDDAPIIRAHDRGDRNVKLFQYYAKRQPDRWVYLYDRAKGSLIDLGQVKALAEPSR